MAPRCQWGLVEGEGLGLGFGSGGSGWRPFEGASRMPSPNGCRRSVGGGRWEGGFGSMSRATGEMSG